MAAISEAKRAANRENAKKSTGPKTAEGKERSRANALKHGLSGAGVVMAEDLERAVQTRVEEWADALKPQNGPERWLVERAAVDSARVDAAVRSERGRHASRLRKDALDPGVGERDGLKVARLGEKLLAGAGDSRPLRLRLHATSAGCDWLIAQWERIARRQEGLRGWSPVDYHHAERLMGGGAVIDARLAGMAVNFLAQLEDEWVPGQHPNQSEAATTRAALRARLALSGWFAKDFALPEDRAGEAGTIARARDGLRSLIAEEIAELRDRRDRLAEIEALDAIEAADRALVDLSAEGLLLSRYEHELHRRVRQSLRELDLLKRRRLDEADTPSAESVPLAEISPPAAPRNEPTAAPKTLAAKGLPPTPPVLPSPFRLDGPQPTPPLPIRMVPATAAGRR